MAPESSFFARLEAVRRTLADHGRAPSALGSIMEFLADPDVRREFFDTLDSPDWVQPLRHEGFFKDSPSVQEARDGRQVHPQWPEGRFLSRVAARAPGEVVSVFLDVQMKNVFVVANLLDAAVSIPARNAAELVPKIVEAAEAEALWIHFSKASDVCVRLAEGGEGSSALLLAGALFGPTAARREDPLKRRDEYWYKDGLKKVVPVLAQREPQAFVRLICGWLEDVVRLRSDLDPTTGDDLSYLWRPAIEEHDQNRDYDLAGVLTGHVRQALESAVAAVGLSPKQAIQVVAASQLLVFRRLRVHFVCEFADEDPASARHTIMDRKLFSDSRFKHEYARLVERRLGLLDRGERDTWFSWIDAGPDMAAFEARVREHQGRDATEEERSRRAEYWRFERLHWVRHHLTGERQSFYSRMLAEHGQPELADLNVRVSTDYGWRASPITVDELSQLPFQQAVERVSSWMPGGDLETSASEGVANAFGEYIATNPRKFSAMAAALEGRPGPYIRAFMGQMTSAARARQPIDVAATLGLCRWIVESNELERSVSLASAGGRGEENPQWTRDEVSRFLLAVLQAREDGAYAYRLGPLRDQLWNVVEGLTRDPVESNIIRDRADDDARAHDYLDMAINSPRGKGVECGLEYARWLSNQVGQSSQADADPAGFAAMPEVRNMLDVQISREQRSVETLAVIGSRLNLIHWIDRDWLVANLNQLFDLVGLHDTPPRTEGWAAWNAFLVWVRPSIGLYRVLEEQFAQGVRLAAGVDPGEATHSSPLKRLAEHLALLFAWGEVNLNEDGTLGEFLERARPETRRHAIQFLGEVLSQPGVPHEFVGRSQALWDYYWTHYGRSDAQEKPGPFLFGPWFSSGRFPPDWALSRLQDWVGVSPVADHGEDVLKELAELAPTHVVQVLDILEGMLNADGEGWRISMWLDSARSILKHGMRADGESRAKAVALIDYLGRRGFTSVGELLELPPRGPE